MVSVAIDSFSMALERALSIFSCKMSIVVQNHFLTQKNPWLKIHVCGFSKVNSWSHSKHASIGWSEQHEVLFYYLYRSSASSLNIVWGHTNTYCITLKDDFMWLWSIALSNNSTCKCTCGCVSSTVSKTFRTAFPDKKQAHCKLETNIK